MAGLLNPGQALSVGRVQLPDRAADPGRWRRVALRWLQTKSVAVDGGWSAPSIVDRRGACGRVPQYGAEEVELRATIPAEGAADGEGIKARWAGAGRCKQWTCPVCSQRLALERAIELTAAMDAAKRAGRGVYMITLTLPHRRGEALADVQSDLLAAWRSVSGGRWWSSVLPAEAGRVGIVRALEVTHGVNGWHPHLHLLVVLGRPLSELQYRMTSSPDAVALGRLLADSIDRLRAQIGELLDMPATANRNWKLRELRDALAETRADRRSLGYLSSEFDTFVEAVEVRWLRALARRGRRGGDVAVAVERVTNPARYLLKAGLEVAGGALKARGKGGSSTPWDLLNKAATAEGASARLENLALFREWEAAQFGRPPITGVGRLGELLWIGAVELEAARAQLDPAPDERVVAVLPVELWLGLVTLGADLVILDLVERGDEQRALAALSVALSSSWLRIRPDKAAALVVSSLTASAAAAAVATTTALAAAL